MKLRWTKKILLTSAFIFASALTNHVALAAATSTTLLNVSYDPTRELYQAENEVQQKSLNTTTAPEAILLDMVKQYPTMCIT